MVTPSLRSVHYLSLPPFPSLSLSLCSYLSHFAFISASLPPALSHTLLTLAFISFHFHLSFTFLSPSSLPFHHAVFWFVLMEKKGGKRGGKFHLLPLSIYSAFLIMSNFSQIQSDSAKAGTCSLSWSFACIPDRVVNSHMR